MDQWKQVSVLDSGRTLNQAVMFTQQLWNMLCLARVIVQGAILRDESRGSHYKPDFPDRDDDKFMKHSIAEYAPSENHGPKITYKDVDISLLKPRKRVYTAGADKKNPAVPKTDSAPTATPAH